MEEIETLLIHLIDHYLLTFQYENAKFYSERLFYEHPSSEHLFLLAKCYFLQGKYQQVYHLLREEGKGTGTGNRIEFLPHRYLFGLVCYYLKKYSECEFVLLPTSSLSSLSSASDSASCGEKEFNPLEMTKEDLPLIPGGASGLYLLGKVCQIEQRKHHAIKYFQTCLEVLSLSVSLPLSLCLSLPLSLSLSSWPSCRWTTCAGALSWSSVRWGYNSTSHTSLTASH
jgi:hypothetical protein